MALLSYLSFFFLEKFEIVSHQYAWLSLENHENILPENKDLSILSFDLNQDEDEIITENDEPSYTRLITSTAWQFQVQLLCTSSAACYPLLFSFEYVSDIGGTAGLVMGLSIASILKIMKNNYYKGRDSLKRRIIKSQSLAMLNWI